MNFCGTFFSSIYKATYIPTPVIRAKVDCTVLAMDQSKDKQVSDNLWQRDYSFCHLLSGVNWNVGEQRL